MIFALKVNIQFIFILMYLNINYLIVNIQLTFNHNQNLQINFHHLIIKYTQVFKIFETGLQPFANYFNMYKV